MNQIDQIIDAMWEKHVNKGEYMIKQGREKERERVFQMSKNEFYINRISRR